MILAHLSKNGSGYAGTVETLTFAPGELRFEPNADKTHDLTPDFRVYRGASEVGAAWTKNAKRGGWYLAVTLDDPAFAAPIQCRLIAKDDRFQLLWAR